jgi:hypothetical protein
VGSSPAAICFILPVVYPFTQTAEPALAVGFIAITTACAKDKLPYNSTRYAGRHGARLATCTSLDPRSTGSFTWERHRHLFGGASDGVYPCLPKWVRLIWVLGGFFVLVKWFIWPHLTQKARSKVLRCAYGIGLQRKFEFGVVYNE